MEENANKLHFNFNSSTRVTVCAECIYMFTEYLKYLSIRRHSCFFSVRALRGLLLPGRLSTVTVSRNFFKQLIDITFYPAFLRKFVCQPLCCVLFQIQTFYQNLVLAAEYHVDCRQTLQ